MWKLSFQSPCWSTNFRNLPKDKPRPILLPPHNRGDNRHLVDPHEATPAQFEVWMWGASVLGLPRSRSQTAKYLAYIIWYYFVILQPVYVLYPLTFRQSIYLPEYFNKQVWLPVTLWCHRFLLYFTCDLLFVIKCRLFCEKTTAFLPSPLIYTTLYVIYVHLQLNCLFI